jgi:peptidyl-prolyl cis-trans isomerase D
MDADVAGAFEADRERWRVPEERSVSYLLLEGEAMREEVEASDTEVLGYYDTHRGEFRVEEQVCARHILIKVRAEEGADGHTEAEGLALAQGLAAELQGGADFAQLATARSEDRGSAERGGDLGCFPRGRMVPAFDEAVFALSPGELSDPVRSGFGFHLINVLSRTDEGTEPLDAVRERIRQIVEQRDLQALIRERLGVVEDALANDRQLETVAADLGLAVTRSAPLRPGSGSEPLVSERLVSRIFSLNKGETAREPFAVPRGIAFVRLEDVVASRLPEFDEVKDQVRAEVERQARFEAARLQAQQLRDAAMRRGLEAAAKAEGLSREETGSSVARGQQLGTLGSGAALDAAVFGLEPATLSEPIRVASGYALVRILEKDSFDPVAFEEQKAQLRSSLTEQRRSQLFVAYLTRARERFDVRRNEEAFARVLG